MCSCVALSHSNPAINLSTLLKLVALEADNLRFDSHDRPPPNASPQDVSSFGPKRPIGPSYWTERTMWQKREIGLMRRATAAGCRPVYAHDGYHKRLVLAIRLAIALTGNSSQYRQIKMMRYLSGNRSALSGLLFVRVPCPSGRRPAGEQFLHRNFL